MSRIPGLRAFVGIAAAIVCCSPFPAAAQDVRIIEIYAMEADGTNVRSVVTIPDYPIINSPEISPDGKWIGVDGWKGNQTLTDAHLLFISLEQDGGRDLGLGAMPTWSADSKWIAYSKYGEGVFIRKFDEVEERLIDRSGWSIQWSPDGQKAAYSRGGNLVVYDIATDTKRLIFPDGSEPYSYIKHNTTWSPDSKQICFMGVSRNDRVEQIATVSVEGDDPKLRVCCRADDFYPDIAWQPGASRIVVPGKPKDGLNAQIHEFDPLKDEPPKRLAGQPTDRHNGGLCWSRDGKTLYFVSYK